MTRHSPGPWVFDERGVDELIDANGCAFVKLDTSWYFKDEDPRRLVNARLIAAAPEMLAILIDARQNGDGCTCEEQGRCCPWCKRIETLLARIDGGE